MYILLHVSPKGFNNDTFLSAEAEANAKTRALEGSRSIPFAYNNLKDPGWMRRPCCTVAPAMALAVGCCKHPTESPTTEHQLPVKDVYSSPDCQTKPNQTKPSRTEPSSELGESATQQLPCKKPANTAQTGGDLRQSSGSEGGGTHSSQHWSVGFPDIPAELRAVVVNLPVQTAGGCGQCRRLCAV